jgi:microcystin-dependent protein
MAIPFLAEVRVFGFNFPPQGWASCDGQILPINQNQALFSLLGTTYGGDGVQTFALPNFQGRMPMHVGNGFDLGQVGGESSHTLTYAEYAHNHQAAGQAGPRTSTTPAGGVLASGDIYGVGPADSSLAAGAVALTGASNAHENRQPYLALNFCIALQGIFPSRS